LAGEVLDAVQNRGTAFKKKENTSIAPLRSEGVLHADPTEKANTSNHEKHLDFQKRGGLLNFCWSGSFSLGQKSYFQCNSNMNYTFLSGVLI
jgi:hypothetical protein